jgi:hypothetical protein
MRTRLPANLSGLEIGLTMPTVARPKDAVDPRTVEQLQALIKKYTEALNNNDAPGVAALFMKNAVFARERFTVQTALRNGMKQCSSCVTAILPPILTHIPPI